MTNAKIDKIQIEPQKEFNISCGTYTKCVVNLFPRHSIWSLDSLGTKSPYLLASLGTIPRGTRTLPTCTCNTLLGFAICFIDEVSEVLAGYRARNWSFYPYIGH